MNLRDLVPLMFSRLFYAAALAFAARASSTPIGPVTAAPARPANSGKVCTVTALGNQTDDIPQILQAFEDCNFGGTVCFPADQNYWISTRLNLVIYDVTIDWQGIWTVRLITFRVIDLES